MTNQLAVPGSSPVVIAHLEGLSPSERELVRHIRKTFFEGIYPRRPSTAKAIKSTPPEGCTTAAKILREQRELRQACDAQRRAEEAAIKTLLGVLAKS